MTHTCRRQLRQLCVFMYAHIALRGQYRCFVYCEAYKANAQNPLVLPRIICIVFFGCARLELSNCQHRRLEAQRHAFLGQRLRLADSAACAWHTTFRCTSAAGSFLGLAMDKHINHNISPDPPGSFLRHAYLC